MQPPSRALIVPFMVAYTALDAILGIAWGIAAETAHDLPAAHQLGAGRLIDELISGDPDPRGLILYWGAGLLWLAVALAVVAALRDTPGAAALAIGHAPPLGPIGIGLVPPRHRVDRVPPWPGRAVDPSSTRMTERGAHSSSTPFISKVGRDTAECRLGVVVLVVPAVCGRRHSGGRYAIGKPWPGSHRSQQVVGEPGLPRRERL